ncbi:MAG: GFA family protein [Pseudomonadota bacterium]
MHTDTWVLPNEVYSARVEGRCVCGAVHWSYDAPLTIMGHCHCSICRKHHGTLFATFVAGPLSTFHWRGGTEKIGTWESSSQGRRSFCSVCGSKVPVVIQASQLVFMPAGALEGELGIRPQMHLFVGSKPPWHMLTDSLPRHDAYPPEWPAQPIGNPERAGREGVVSGSCGCGAIRFEIEGRPQLMRHCHCGRCRHARGAAHATNLVYQIEALRFTQGEEWLVDFQLPEAQFFGTGFCGICGGAMPRRSPGRGRVVVPAGTLDSDPGMLPMMHQYVASKAPWFDITDGVPQFAGAPP